MKPGGRIVIADETIPKSALLRVLILPFVRWPFFRVLSLVTSNKYRKVFDVEKMYARAGLVKIKTHGNPFQYLALVEGFKKE